MEDYVHPKRLIEVAAEIEDAFEFSPIELHQNRLFRKAFWMWMVSINVLAPWSLLIKGPHMVVFYLHIVFWYITVSSGLIAFWFFQLRRKFKYKRRLMVSSDMKQNAQMLVDSPKAETVTALVILSYWYLLPDYMWFVCDTSKIVSNRGAQRALYVALAECRYKPAPDSGYRVINSTTDTLNELMQLMTSISFRNFDHKLICLTLDVLCKIGDKETLRILIQAIPRATGDLRPSLEKVKASLEAKFAENELVRASY